MNYTSTRSCCGYDIFALVKILQLFKEVYCYLDVILRTKCKVMFLIVIFLFFFSMYLRT